ncbi:MAG: hypothetical protein WD270_06550 [Acetobacterales bacterium]
MSRIARVLAMTVVAAAVVAAGLALPASDARAELRTAQHPGAGCIAYPPYRNDVAIPYQFLLFGIDQQAFCHIRIDDEMPADDIHVVFVYGSNVEVRLCLHREGDWVRCGSMRSIGSARSMTWVGPPYDLPSTPSGAFLSVRFVGGLSLVDEYDVLWSIPE